MQCRMANPARAADKGLRLKPHCIFQSRGQGLRPVSEHPDSPFHASRLCGDHGVFMLFLSVKISSVDSSGYEVKHQAKEVLVEGILEKENSVNDRASCLSH